jgi:hypothetical protein
MSGFGQTTPRGPDYVGADREVSVPTYVLYGLNEAGVAAHAEELSAETRMTLEGLARERLRSWPGVEIWDGPVCIVRLTRTAAETN